MSKKNTYYKNRYGQEIPADVTLVQATPTDSTATISPMVNGGNTHIVKWGT